MALLFRRWGPPMISVAFFGGLQLTGAVEQTAGWILIGVALVGALIYVLVERRHEGDELEEERRGRTGAKLRDSTLSLRRSRIKNQDRSIDAESSDVEIEDSDIR